MKHNKKMNMCEFMNFDRDVVNYINDNLGLIKENAEACENDDLAVVSLEHYTLTVEGYNEEDEFLSASQKERFLFIAERLFRQGFVEHAGILNPYLLSGDELLRTDRARKSGRNF